MEKLDVGKRSRVALMRAIEISRKALRPFREKRQSLIEDYVGSEWGDVGEGKRETIANILALTADTYSMALAANRPRVLVTTRQKDKMPFAKRFQIATNNLIEEIRLEQVLKRCVNEAFFNMAVAKVFLAPAGAIQVPNPEFPIEPGPFAGKDAWERYQDLQRSIPQNVWLDPGKPYVECVDFDNFVFDTQADAWEKIRFAVHEYRVPFESLKNDDRFDKKVVEKLFPTSKWPDSPGSDGENTVRSMVNYHDHDELEPMITLADVWLPAENRWCVFAGSGNHPPLFVDDWTGPEGGPFHILGFGDVPGHIMPLSPGMNLKSLHRTLNLLLRKCIHQAKTQKTITTFAGHERDAKSVRDARDGEMVRVNNPDMIRELSYNGVNQLTLMFEQTIDGIFSRMAGNLDAMAGLGPQAETAKQDSLIHSAVSKREAKMQYRVVEFAANICRDLGHYLWNDNLKEIPGQYTPPGIGLSVDASWSPGERMGDYADYEFNVEPYSMRYQSPSERLSSVLNIVQSIHIPMMQVLREQGGTIDLQALTKLCADLGDMPHLNEVITFANPVEMSGGGDEMRMPAMTSRQYIRRDAGTTPQGERVAAMQSLMSMGGESQPGTNLGG